MVVPIHHVWGALKRIIFPLESLAKIRRGQLSGLKYRITENSGWAPIIGRWEPGAHFVYSRLIAKGDVVYDLGANCGLHTMLFSILVGENGRVYAFEPLPENIRELSENLSINGLKNVNIVQKAVSAKDGVEGFTTARQRKQGSLQAKPSSDANRIDVLVTSLDSFVRSATTPSFVKIDVEGVEGHVIKGASSLIKEYKPLLSIELHSPEQDVMVGSLLSEAGYSLFEFNPSIRRPTKFRAITTPHLGWPNANGTWGTVLAIPKTRIDLLKRLYSH